MKFTANQRKAIYGAVAAIATISVAFGIVTADELVLTADSITRLLTELGSILATILAMANITPDE